MHKPASKSPVLLDYSKLLGFDQIASNTSSLGNKLGAKVGGKPVDETITLSLGTKVGAKVGLKPAR